MWGPGGGVIDITEETKLTYESWPLHGDHGQDRAPLRMEDDIPHGGSAWNV